MSIRCGREERAFQLDVYNFCFFCQPHPSKAKWFGEADAGWVSPLPTEADTGVSHFQMARSRVEAFPGFDWLRLGRHRRFRLNLPIVVLQRCVSDLLSSLKASKIQEEAEAAGRGRIVLQGRGNQVRDAVAGYQVRSVVLQGRGNQVRDAVPGYQVRSVALQGRGNQVRDAVAGYQVRSVVLHRRGTRSECDRDGEPGQSVTETVNQAGCYMAENQVTSGTKEWNRSGCGAQPAMRMDFLPRAPRLQ